MKPIILIVDDDNAHRGMLTTLLRGWGYDTAEATDGTEAVDFVHEKAVDLVLSDVRMAHMDGISALSEIRRWNPAIPVIIMTAWSSVENAVEAMRLGAFSYVTKPFDFDALKSTITSALAHTHPSESSDGDCAPLTTAIIGDSPAMQDLLHIIQTVAPTDATVLITGESGTGKELVARAIQSGSARRDKPFITLNCAAISESLLESELFGHEKGSFTGADRRRDGRFAQADGGTLFLDEIGEMPLSLQAKLLRVLQQGEVQRVGSDEALHVDVRIIAATNRILSEEVAAGHFREDLYYRLNVIALEVPPLRKRREDIAPLTQTFLARYAAANRKELKGFTPQAMDMLLRYDWPGNVRELENAVERAVILCTSDYITERSLPLSLQNFEEPAAAFQLSSRSLEDVERDAIAATLADTDANKSEAARRLGITRATLHSKLKKYKLK